MTYTSANLFIDHFKSTFSVPSFSLKGFLCVFSFSLSTFSLNYACSANTLVTKSAASFKAIAE